MPDTGGKMSDANLSKAGIEYTASGSINDNPDFYEKQAENGYDDNFMGTGLASTSLQITKILNAAGLYKPSELNYYDNFFRYAPLDPYNILGPTREYVFFIKPDLHIFKSYDGNPSNKPDLQTQLANNPFFVYLRNHGYSKDISQLQKTHISSASPFINLLTNRKVGSMDLTSITADTFETSRNYYGTMINYRKASEPSDENVDINIEFEDTKFLEVYMLFKAYDEYERLKWYGRISPPLQSYIWYKVLHDQMGIFRFLVDEDGEHIVHWSQFWGVIPTNVPREVFSDIPQDGHLKFTVNFKATFMADMDPNTLLDFNALVVNSIGSKNYFTGPNTTTGDNNKDEYSNKYRRIYNWDDVMGLNPGTIARMPYIEFDDNSSRGLNSNGTIYYSRPKLVWYANESAHLYTAENEVQYKKKST